MADPGVIINAAGTQDVDAFTDALIAALPPIYQKDSKDTVLYKLFRILAEELVRADIAIESVGNDNYLSVPVTNELTIRSKYDRDRLQNENAFELDSVRFTNSNTQILQNTFLEEGDNQVQLFFIPLTGIDILVFDATAPERVPLNFPTTFDPVTNVVTINSSRRGPFTIGYTDTGDVVRLSENITVPEGIFLLGWDEGGWDELGFGE